MASYRQIACNFRNAVYKLWSLHSPGPGDRLRVDKRFAETLEQHQQHCLRLTTMRECELSGSVYVQMKKQTLAKLCPCAQVKVMRVVNKAKVNYVILVKYNTGKLQAHLCERRNEKSFLILCRHITRVHKWIDSNEKPNWPMRADESSAHWFLHGPDRVASGQIPIGRQKEKVFAFFLKPIWANKYEPLLATRTPIRRGENKNAPRIGIKPHAKILLSLMKLNSQTKSTKNPTTKPTQTQMTIIMCLAARNPFAMPLSDSLKKIKFEIYSFASHSCVAWSDGFKRFSTHFFLFVFVPSSFRSAALYSIS